MKKVKVAQIGTSQNSHGNHVWRSLLKQDELFDVVGYALPEGERKKFPKKAVAFEGHTEMTVEEILASPEIEAVVVETEERYLTKYATLAAEAGKHVHMEKPGGTSWREFKNLVDILRSKNLVFSTGYMYRFNPKIQEAIAKIKQGELGDIYSVEAHMDCKHTTEVKQWLENFPGGMMFFLGCHLIDLIYQIQGEPAQVIPLNCATGIDGVTAKDYGMAVLQYPNGISFAKSCASESGGFLRRQLVICGEKGTIEIKPLEILTKNGQYTVSQETYGKTGADWHIPWSVSKTEEYDRYDPMMRNFAEMVRGKENPYSYDYELGLYRLILKACGEIIQESM